MNGLEKFFRRFDCNHYWFRNQKHGQPCWACGTPYRNMRLVSGESEELYKLALKNPAKYYRKVKL